MACRWSPGQFAVPWMIRCALHRLSYETIAELAQSSLTLETPYRFNKRSLLVGCRAYAAWVSVVIFVAGAELVGRTRELSALLDVLNEVAAGRGGVVWIEGEPGIGKSTLVSALLATASDVGCLVRSGAGADLAGEFPLLLMADCLGVSVRSEDPEIVEIAKILRGEATPPCTVDPVAVAGERMLAVVDRWCAAGPVVLAVEDLHWADEASLELWSRLAKSVDQIPLLLVASARPVPRRPALERVRNAAPELGARVVALAPLSVTDAIDIAGRRLRAAPGPRLAAELARAGGNPLYLRELVDALQADGSVSIADEKAELVLGTATMPQSLMDALGRRLAFLSESTVQALKLAALLGAEFHVAEWAAVAERSPIELAEVVEEATAAGLLEKSTRGLEFRHDLIRQALVKQTAPSLRIWIHREIARKLAVAGCGNDEVARHLLAGPPLDDWALTWLAELPEAQIFAGREVFEELLSWAVEQLNTDDHRWEVLASQLAQMRYRMGRDEAAAQTSQAVLGHTVDAELAGLMRVQAVRALGRLGQYDESIAIAKPGLDDPATPPRWRARLRSWAANATHCQGRCTEAHHMALAALEEAIACGDHLGAGYARLVLIEQSAAEQRREYAEQALASLGDDHESLDLRLLILTHYLGLLEEGGAAAEVDALLPEALMAAEAAGSPRAYWVRSAAAWIFYLRGDWDEVLRQLAMIPETFEPLLADACCYRVEFALRRDQPELADSHLRSAGLSGQLDEGPPFNHRSRELATPLMLRAAAAGHYDRALARGRDLLADPLPHPMASSFPLHLVRIALEVGDVASAKAAADWAAHSEWPEALGARCGQALIEEDAAALVMVAEEYQRRGWRTLQAFALEEAAVHLGRIGAVEQARTALAQALQLYTGFGATMDMRRAQSRLRPYGVRLGSRTLQRRGTRSWESLTPSEVRIATLVSEGLSNPDIAARLYVSRSTVQTHVSSILAKLELKSRVELINRLAADR
jgi:DNA-binding NarL/FixJ family response regulator